ncbi:hypothetical protein GQ44DRAFT_703434 [Phaeosphaeriaceae sp. PMI808]|nr:hypothetical protein GQ44DRAFT_703434 [Phaeosphaeriaceae sp. PMI808]
MSQSDVKPLPFVYQFAAGKSQLWHDCTITVHRSCSCVPRYFLGARQKKLCAAPPHLLYPSLSFVSPIEAEAP